ncbi:MAG: phosphotransferase enzyme family protein [Chloroflexota bacterium]
MSAEIKEMLPLNREKILTLVNELYRLPNQVKKIQIISPDKVLLHDNSGTFLFKRHITLEPDGIRELETIYRKSIASGLCPDFLPPRQGDIFGVSRGDVFSLQPLLKNDAISVTQEPAKFGRALGRLHKALAGVLTKPLRSHFDQLLPSLVGPAKRYGLADIVSLIKEVENKRATCQDVIHGDLHPGNVLRHDGKILFLDLDSASSSAYEVDIAFAAFRFFHADRKAQNTFLHGYGLPENYLDNLWKYLIFTIAQRIIFILASREHDDKRWEYDLVNQMRFLQEAKKRLNTSNDRPAGDEDFLTRSGKRGTGLRGMQKKLPQPYK